MLIDNTKTLINPNQIVDFLLNDRQKINRIINKLIKNSSKVLIQIPSKAEKGKFSILYKMSFVKMINQFKNRPKILFNNSNGIKRKAIPAYIIIATGNTINKLLRRKYIGNW